MAAAVVLSSALVTKAFTSLACNLRTHNLDVLLSLIPFSDKPRGPGLLTYSNHISTLDDPLWCGALPLRCFTDYTAFRWTLGASNICFTNPLFSAYFSAGKVLETDRKAGIYQHSIDKAIQALQAGQWVHIFPEGYVNQPKAPHGVDPHQLLRFRWGISRILLESPLDTYVLPMHLQGYDQIMPEGRAFPWKFMPKPGARLSIDLPDKPLDRRRLLDPLITGSDQWARGGELRAPYQGEDKQLRQARIEVSQVLRNELRALQRRAMQAS